MPTLPHPGSMYKKLPKFLKAKIFCRYADDKYLLYHPLFMKFASGPVLLHDGIVQGYAAIDGASVKVFEGECPEKPFVTGVILPSPANCHTHCADGNLRIEKGMSIEELVAPPDGLKHRYLREAPASELKDSMMRFSAGSVKNGICGFIDFREGGVAGCRLLRESSPDAIVLGRPLSPEFDPEEISDILDVADGIGLSSITDIGSAYAEKIADAVRKRRKVLAIHVSERVRENIDDVLVLDPAFVVHMNEATDSDMLKCSEAEVPAVVCPRSNAFFGKMPPVDRMKRCGLDFSIGTDNAMLCSPDIRRDALLASQVLMVRGMDPAAIWEAMAFNSRKIFHRCRGRADAGNAVSVFPCPDPDRPLSALMSDAPVPIYGRRM